jgi:hypothetical protein
MKKIFWSLTINLCFLVIISAGAFAATDTKTLTINVLVGCAATLTIDKTAINFANANPDTAPNIAAVEGAVGVHVKIRTGVATEATLVHLADGPLTSGSDTIAINNVSWIATGTGFTAGTMSSSAPVSAGSLVGSGTYDGAFIYTLVNSWDYAVGSYTTSSTYTLAAP